MEQNDHDLLIQIKANLKTLCEKVDKINGNITSHGKRLAKNDLNHVDLDSRVTILEHQPSVLRAIILTGTVISVLNGGLVILLKFF